MIKNPPAKAGYVKDMGSILGSGRSPGEGNGNPLQYSCLENPMDGGAWSASVHGVTKSQTRLSDFTSLSLPLELTGWISLYSKGLSRVFSNTTVQKHQFFVIEDRLKEPGEWELRRRVPEVCRKEKDKAMAQEGNQLFHVFSRGTPSACTGAPNQHPGHRLHCHSVLS